MPTVTCQTSRYQGQCVSDRHFEKKSEQSGPGDEVEIADILFSKYTNTEMDSVFFDTFSPSIHFCVKMSTMRDFQTLKLVKTIKNNKDLWSHSIVIDRDDSFKATSKLVYLYISPRETVSILNLVEYMSFGVYFGHLVVIW